MDTGVLEALKRIYKKLLRKLTIEKDNGADIGFLKSVTMKVVVDMIAEIWDEIEPSTIRRSWRRLPKENFR